MTYIAVSLEMKAVRYASSRASLAARGSSRTWGALRTRGGWRDACASKPTRRRSSGRARVPAGRQAQHLPSLQASVSMRLKNLFCVVQ